MAKLQGMELVKEAAPYLKELRGQSNETVHLAVLDEGKVLYLAKEEPSQSIRMVSRVGRHVPAHCTGLGKVLLAYLGEEEREKIIRGKGLASLTKNTITGEGKLGQEISKIREQGFAEDRVAAISISGPAFRLN